MREHIEKVVTLVFLALVLSSPGPVSAGGASNRGVLVSLPKTGEAEEEFIPDKHIATEPDEIFVEECLEYFKNRDYFALYNRMSDHAKKMPFTSMVNLFSAEEKILGPLKEYRQFGRVPPPGSPSPHSDPVSFQYICVFDCSEGVAIVNIITENSRFKVNEFKILSEALLTKEAKALLSQVKAEQE